MDPQSWYVDSDSDTSGDGNSTELCSRTNFKKRQKHDSNCLPKILSCMSFSEQTFHVTLLAEPIAMMKNKDGSLPVLGLQNFHHMLSPETMKVTRTCVGLVAKYAFYFQNAHFIFSMYIGQSLQSLSS